MGTAASHTWKEVVWEDRDMDKVAIACARWRRSRRLSNTEFVRGDNCMDQVPGKLASLVDTYSSTSYDLIIQ